MRVWHLTGDSFSFVCIRVSRSTSNRVTRSFPIGIKPRDRFEFSALEAIAFMVGQGLGVALLPDWRLSWR